MNQAAIDVGVEGEVELLQGFLVAEVGPAKGGFQPFLGSSGDFILDDGCQKIHVGQLFLDGLTISGL